MLRDVPRETFGLLETYRTLLLKWQRTINLVSRGTLDDFWMRHVLDSWQIIPYLSGHQRILDVGSGGGFPGMVLAIAGGFDVTCVDSDVRKMQFLDEVAWNLGAKVSLKIGRIEEFQDCTFDAICARAFGPLRQLLAIAQKHSSGYGVFHKGQQWESELQEASRSFEFTYEIFPSKVDPRGRIMIVDKVSAK
jgi:16S rRNA (guanine527-N7)-methyltransferase